MNVTLKKTTIVTERPVIAAPPSKSDAHRLLILAALSDDDIVQEIFLSCSDTNADIDATIGCLTALGARIVSRDGGYAVTPIDRNAVPKDEIHMSAGESGSTLRFLIPVIGALGVKVCIKMEGRLPYRPLSPLDTVLMEHGMTLTRDAEDETLLHLSGQLSAGIYEIDGSVSSQFISGLLFALPLLSSPTVLRILGTIASSPYINLTLTALRRFGYVPVQEEYGHRYDIEPARFHANNQLSVEGDWSGAAFPLCAGALTPAGVTVTGLNKDSVQGDRRILSVLRDTGCAVIWTPNPQGGDDLTVKPPVDTPMRAFKVDADDIPDLVPPMAVLSCAAQGETRITNCGRLRIKESDRLAATVSLIEQLGGCVNTDGDTIISHGFGSLTGGRAEGCNDHRMVMSAALGALLTTADVEITDAEAIRKSYPAFFHDFTSFGVEIQYQD